MKTSTPLYLLPLAALCAAAGASAQSPAQSPTPEQVHSHSHAAPATAQDLSVVRDADTGRLRAPTPAELRALQAKAPPGIQPPARPAMTTGPDGRRQVRLGERGLVYSVVKRGADGKLDQHCAQGEDAATRALAGPATAGSDAAQATPASSRQEARHAQR